MGLGSGIRVQRSKRHRIPDLDPQHCIRHFIYIYLYLYIYLFLCHHQRYHFVRSGLFLVSFEPLSEGLSLVCIGIWLSTLMRIRIRRPKMMRILNTNLQLPSPDLLFSKLTPYLVYSRIKRPAVFVHALKRRGR
jgi:hypothetical protein